MRLWCEIAILGSRMSKIGASFSNEQLREQYRTEPSPMPFLTRYFLLNMGRFISTGQWPLSATISHNLASSSQTHKLTTHPRTSDHRHATSREAQISPQLCLDPSTSTSVLVAQH